MVIEMNEKRGLVIRTYGNIDMSGTANMFESMEIKRLQAEIGISNHIRNQQYQRMIAEARRKYRIKPTSRFRRKMLGIYGLLILLIRGEYDADL